VNASVPLMEQSHPLKIGGLTSLSITDKLGLCDVGGTKEAEHILIATVTMIGEIRTPVNKDCLLSLFFCLVIREGEKHCVEGLAKGSKAYPLRV